MAILVVQRPSLTGNIPAGANAAGHVPASSGGDSFQNTGTEFFRVTNSHATTSRTVTFDSPGTCSFGLPNNAAHDQVVTVAALTTMTIGPFAPSRFNDSNNRVQVTYSGAAADLTVVVESST